MWYHWQKACIRNEKSTKLNNGKNNGKEFKKKRKEIYKTLRQEQLKMIEHEI